MTSAAPAAPILAEIEAHQRRARTRFRAQSGAVWVVLIGGLGIALWSTGNINADFIGTWGPFIVGGAGLTILLSVSSILFATVLAILGAIGRLSKNAFINGVASLYVSLVRGTPLLVQIYFVYLALPQFGVVLDPIPAVLLQVFRQIRLEGTSHIQRVELMDANGDRTEIRFSHVQTGDALTPAEERLLQ